jgi:hypothetical protein
MGHKGVAKRKTSKQKAKVLPVETASGSISALLRTTESQPGNAQGIGGMMPFTKTGVNPSSGGKKKSKKG